MKKKVLLLGGGPAALATAFELTATCELRRNYSVTILQRGWRLGGKCASGRSGEEMRNKEHGLHCCFGFYENTLNLMRRCYRDVHRDPRMPLATFEQAFSGLDDIVLYERWDGRLVPHVLHVPPRQPRLGHSFLVLRAVVLEWLWNTWRQIKSQIAGKSFPPQDLLEEAAERAQEEKAAARPLHDTAKPPSGGRAPAQVTDLLKAFIAWLDGDKDLPAILYNNDDWRFFVMALDLVAAVLTGIGEIHRGTKANDVDFKDWLRSHGAKDTTVDGSPLVTIIYDLVFAYEDGDTGQPSLAAGKAIQALIRIALTYDGSVIYKMQAGTGDTVIAPLYQLLHRRGVTFRFFHCVTGLEISGSPRTVGTVEVVPQVELAARYDPLIEVRGLPCWPDEPRWNLLNADHAAALKASKANLEVDDNPLERQPLCLRKGLDFDIVVLAIPPPALGAMGPVLQRTSPAMHDMLSHMRSVATQGVQLWLTSNVEGADPGSDLPPEAVTGTFGQPINTYFSMPHVLATEAWPDDSSPRALAYLCGPLPEEHVKDPLSTVRDHARTFLQQSAPAIWPALAPDGTFDWNHLHAPHSVVGEDRLDDQYLRANAHGSERYVLTLPGSVRHRLRANESGIDNLILAGDWTRNGLCGGALEAAVTSGMQAARAISGKPATIPGLVGWLCED